MRISNKAGAMAGALGLRRNELEGFRWPGHDGSVCVCLIHGRGVNEMELGWKRRHFFFALTWL